MTDDERELMKQMAGWLGAISSALADGAGIHGLQSVHRSGMQAIGPLFERVYATKSTDDT
jgi:hypothetical protein